MGLNLRAVLLGFLARGDHTGYELKHLMERSVGYFFGASYGSIYPALKDLEGASLVRSTRVVQPDRPNKKVYTITPEGEAYFREALGEPPAPDNFRSEFLMRLFFGHHYEPGRLLELVRQYRAEHEQMVERLREVEEEFREVATPYQMMCLRSGLSHAGSRVAFLREIEEEIHELASSPGAATGAHPGP
jgi:DNA-binding PadR family transcriptional regulator